MSMVKVRLKEVAADLGMAPKEVSETLAKFFEKPKSNTQVLTDEELNVLLDYVTQQHQIDSLEQVFAVQAKPEEKKPEPKKEEPKKEEAKPAQAQNAGKPEEKKQAAPAAAKKSEPAAAAVPEKKNEPAAPVKQKEPERKRERRIVDTSAVQVNSARFDDRVDSLVSERVQNYQGGKQRIGGKKGQQQNKKDNKFRGNKSRNEEQEKLRRLQMEVARKAPVTVRIPEEITVGELASRMKKTSGEVIKLLMKNGVMAGINQTIDFDTAEFVATEMGCKVEKEVTVTIEEKIIDAHEDTAEELQTRAPVVVVMGHVDHGKTSLLDAIRKTSVTAGEAGGITQHIGAYTVDVGGNMVTFLDTPGHAAFTSMRARGAMCTDIAILVVAADDGIMPQTIESINHAKAANVPIIVAINKMDKEGANPDRVMQQLTEHELVPEEWGGNVICVPVSAKTKMGIDKLLETINLVAEMCELKANPDRTAKGVVIEAKLDKGRGPIATLLVQNGTLNAGDVIVAGTAVGKVRAMVDCQGKKINSAAPSVPVEIMGLDNVPMSGDLFNAVSDEKLARQLVEQRKAEAKEEEFKAFQKVTLDTLFDTLHEGELKELNIIVKADVQGSVEAVKQSLLKIENDEVRVKIIHGGVGTVNDSDVMLANASNAIIVGFAVGVDPIAQENANRDGIEIKTYDIIYDAIEDIENAMRGMRAPKYRDVDTGSAEVREVYKISSAGTIAGCVVTSGTIRRGGKIRVIRNDKQIADVEIANLKRFKDEVKEVSSGYECGISLVGFDDIQAGDIFEAYIVEEYRD